MSKGARKKAARAAAPQPPATFPKSIADCQHAGGKWSIPARVVNLWTRVNEEVPVEQDPGAQLVGHVLNVSNVRCLECGQEFRFANMIERGDPMKAPCMLNQRLALVTKIEADRRILTVADTPGGRIQGVGGAGPIVLTGKPN